MSGERDPSVRVLNKVVVPEYVTIVCDGIDAVPFIDEVVDGLRHLALRGIFVCHFLHPQQFRFLHRKYRRGILLSPFQIVISRPSVLTDSVFVFFGI